MLQYFLYIWRDACIQVQMAIYRTVTYVTGNDLTLLPRLPSHFPERTLTGKTLKKENSRKIFKISDSKFQ